MFIVSALIAVGSGDFAWAQDDDVFMLEEVKVTAQKREESQQKVAAAMDVISGAEVAELGKNDVSEILSDISSVLMTKGTDGLKVSLRGVSQDGQPSRGLQTKTPTVAVNTDGVYSNRNSQGSNMFDIERVEVLFGPQSTMYASATPGGIVNIITADPKLDTYYASGTLEVGNYDLLHTEGVVNAPINSDFAFRAGFSSTKRDGYLSNGAEDEDSRVARLKMIYEPSETFSVVLTGETQKIGGQGFAGVALFVDESDVDDPWTSDEEVAGPNRMTDKQKVYAHINWDTALGSLTILPSWSEKDFTSSESSTGEDDDGNATEIVEVAVGDGVERGVEMRMVSSEDFSIKWIGGLNYYYSKDYVINTRYEDGEYSQFNERYVESESKAIFANVTYPLTETFRPIVGFRYTWDSSDWYNNEDPAPPGKTMPEGTVHDYNDWNAKLGFEFDLSDASMLYADWSAGHRVVGSGTDRYGNALPPEKLSAYTIGAKNRFLDNKLQVNVAAYFYDYTDQIATMGVDTIVDDNENGIRDYTDANGNGVFDDGDTWTENDSMMDEGAKASGDLEIYGFDLQTSTILSAKDKLDFSVSYVHKTWTRLLFDFYDITNSLGIEDLDYSGKTATFAPEWTIQLSYEHSFSLPSGGSLVPRLDARYTSDFKMYFLDETVGFDSDEDEVVRVDVSDYAYQEPYTLLDFTAVYSHPDGKWTLTGYVKNLTDYAVKRQIKVAGSTSSQLMLDAPRTIGAILSVRF
jgi:iron complex outermembrane receptor protein